MAFSVLLLFMTIAIGYTIITASKVEELGNNIIEYRQATALLSQELAAKVNLATSILHEIISTGRMQHRQHYVQLQQEIEVLVDRIIAAANSHNEIATTMSLHEVRSLLHELDPIPDKLLYFHSHPAENNLGLVLATKELNPISRTYLGRVNELITMTQEESLLGENSNILPLLYELRNSWHGVTNSLRLYFTIQEKGILINHRNYLDVNNEILQKLEPYRKVLEDIGFDTFDELLKINKLFSDRLPKVLKIYQTDQWRADVNLIKTDVQPVINKLRKILHDLADKQSHLASEESLILSDELKNIALSNVVLLLIILTVGLIIASLISNHIANSIKTLADGAQNVSNGNLETQVTITSHDELGLLAQDFNKMVQQLKKAAKDETDFRDQLNKLNASLEDRVARRTNELKVTQEHLIQNEKLAGIGQLAAGIAHEINNPVGYINSNIGSMEKYINSIYELVDLYAQHEECLPDATQQNISGLKQQLEYDYIKQDLSELINETKEGVTRVKDIVQDLKDFSHVNEQTWAISDLHQGISSTLNIVSNEVKYKADVIKDFGDIPNIECVLPQINQVFMNLIVNASHSIKEHGTITIRTFAEQHEGRDGVSVEVSDTGKGIKPENVNKIFEPFFTTKPVGKGTGLGLSLSYGIVKKHGGCVEVNSVLDEGTTFHVWLPVTQDKTEGLQPTGTS